MDVTTSNPVALALERDGGCVITGRVFYWSEHAPGKWVLEEKFTQFQQITRSQEVQEIRLPPGSYRAAFMCRVEESLNGVYSLSLSINGLPVADKHGDVNSTSKPHDSEEFVYRFMLTLQ